MKKIIFAALAIVLIDAFQPMEDVSVKHTMENGEYLWNVVSDAMKETNDPRSIDEVVFETRKLNNLENGKLATLKYGDTIVIPCKRNKWF